MGQWANKITLGYILYEAQCIHHDTQSDKNIPKRCITITVRDMVTGFDNSIVLYGNQIFIQAESINQLRLSPIDGDPNYLDALPESP